MITITSSFGFKYERYFVNLYMTNGQPAYIRTYESGGLIKRIERCRKKYSDCTICPHKCHVNRYIRSEGFCKSGFLPVVSSAGRHLGEEPPLVGKNGSGTIFFTHCNLKCIYCQNYDISHEGSGTEIIYKQLADIMVSLQDEGCHNINFVTPTHMVLSILEALPMAIEKGLNIPLVYNSGGYDSVETLQLLDGIIDIYMPDFKYMETASAEDFSKVKLYPQLVKNAISLMHQQVGDLKLNDEGIAYRGLMVRHLILSGFIDESKQVIDYISDLSKDTYLNLMDQYHPEFRACEERRLSRRVSRKEYFEVINYAKNTGLRRLEYN